MLNVESSVSCSKALCSLKSICFYQFQLIRVLEDLVQQSETCCMICRCCLQQQFFSFLYLLSYQGNF